MKKRLFSIFVSMMMGLSLLPVNAIAATTGNQSAVLLGDLNGDGAITNADVAMLMVKITSGEEISLSRGDLNGDGQITNADVAALMCQVTAN